MNSVTPEKDYTKTLGWRKLPDPIQRVVIKILTDARREYQIHKPDVEPEPNAVIPYKNPVAEELAAKENTARFFIDTYFKVLDKTIKANTPKEEFIERSYDAYRAASKIADNELQNAGKGK